MGSSKNTARFGSQETPLAGAVLCALALAELASLFGSSHYSTVLTTGLTLSLPFVFFRSLQTREIALLSLCLLLALVIWLTRSEALSFMAEGLSRSAFLAAFIVLLAALREGASSSPSVKTVGLYLTDQPPGRRFLSVFSGSHLLSSLINLGSLSLLAPIIQQGVRGDLSVKDELSEIQQIRERRQLTAALRGFAWFLLWAPTAVTQAVLPGLLGRIDSIRLIITGLAVAASMMILGWIEDTLRWRAFSKQRRRNNQQVQRLHLAFPARAFVNIATIALLLFGLAASFSSFGATNLISGVMLACPLVVIIWLLVQRAGMDQAREIATIRIPAYYREVLFVAAAGFIGTVGAKLVPAAAFADAIALSTIPQWLVLWLLSISVWVAGQIGLSPITMAVFLGTIVSEMPEFPIDLTWTALAIAAGTALSSNGAPFSAGVLMLSRATGHSPYTLSWKWNGPFTLMAMVQLAVIFWALTSL